MVELAVDLGAPRADIVDGTLPGRTPVEGSAGLIGVWMTSGHVRSSDRWLPSWVMVRDGRGKQVPALPAGDDTRRRSGRTLGSATTVAETGMATADPVRA